jgi:hypothetical protein
MPSKPGEQRLKRLTDEIAKLQSARFVVTQRLNQDIDATRQRAEEAAQKFFGLSERPQMGGGQWVCKDSPNGYCWYSADDHARDYCIVCGDPEERK